MKPRFIKVKSRYRERWKEYLPGYWISSCGRWWSVKSERLLKQDRNDSGYYRAQICVNGAKKKIFTHIAVCDKFGDCNGKTLPDKLRAYGLSIDHISRRKDNNSVFNLEIVPHAENVTRFYIKKRERELRNEFENPDEEIFG